MQVRSIAFAGRRAQAKGYHRPSRPRGMRPIAGQRRKAATTRHNEQENVNDDTQRFNPSQERVREHHRGPPKGLGTLSQTKTRKKHSRQNEGIPQHYPKRSDRLGILPLATPKSQLRPNDGHRMGIGREGFPRTNSSSSSQGVVASPLGRSKDGSHQEPQTEAKTTPKGSPPMGILLQGPKPLQHSKDTPRHQEQSQIEAQTTLTPRHYHHHQLHHQQQQLHHQYYYRRAKARQARLVLEPRADAGLSTKGIRVGEKQLLKHDGALRFVLHNSTQFRKQSKIFHSKAAREPSTNGAPRWAPSRDGKPWGCYAFFRTIKNLRKLIPTISLTN